MNLIRFPLLERTVDQDDEIELGFIAVEVVIDLHNEPGAR
jgi:hypothetical protein